MKQDQNRWLQLAHVAVCAALADYAAIPLMPYILKSFHAEFWDYFLIAFAILLIYRGFCNLLNITTIKVTKERLIIVSMPKRSQR